MINYYYIVLLFCILFINYVIFEIVDVGFMSWVWLLYLMLMIFEFNLILIKCFKVWMLCLKGIYCIYVMFLYFKKNNWFIYCNVIVYNEILLW